MQGNHLVHLLCQRLGAEQFASPGSGLSFELSPGPLVRNQQFTVIDLPCVLLPAPVSEIGVRHEGANLVEHGLNGFGWEPAEVSRHASGHVRRLGIRRNAPGLAVQPDLRPEESMTSRAVATRSEALDSSFFNSSRVPCQSSHQRACPMAL
jgi:hypothetical protein